MPLTVRSLRKNEAGATAVEYALISALISVIVILAVVSLGNPVSGLFGTVVDQFDAVETFMD